MKSMKKLRTDDGVAIRLKRSIVGLVAQIGKSTSPKKNTKLHGLVLEFIVATNSHVELIRVLGSHFRGDRPSWANPTDRTKEEKRKARRRRNQSTSQEQQQQQQEQQQQQQHEQPLLRGQGPRVGPRTVGHGFCRTRFKTCQRHLWWFEFHGGCFELVVAACPGIQNSQKFGVFAKSIDKKTSPTCQTKHETCHHHVQNGGETQTSEKNDRRPTCDPQHCILGV